MSEYPTVRKLIETRARAWNESKELITTAHAESREMTPEEREKWVKCHKDVDLATQQIDDLNRQMELDAELRKSELSGKDVDEQRRRKLETPEKRQIDPDKAYDLYLRYGFSRLAPEARSAINTFELTDEYLGTIEPEYRDLVTTSPTAGGTHVPVGFRNIIEENRLAYGGVRNTRYLPFPTSGGGELRLPTSDDTANASVIVAEGAAVAADADPTTSEIISQTVLYNTKIVKVSVQMLQDSAFDVQGWLGRIFGERDGRGQNVGLTTGSGVAGTAPQGVVTGATASAALTAEYSYANMVALEHTLDPAYRMDNPQWMFHDAVLQKLKELVDLDGRPLWVPGMAVSQPNRILGYEYVINQAMGGTGTPADGDIVFGAFSKFLIRDTQTIQMFRFDEKFMDEMKVGYMAWSRMDSRVLDAGTAPIIKVDYGP